MLKKCWINKNERLFTISFESKDVDIPLIFREFTFPDKSSEEHPQRHVVNLGMFSEEDLINIMNTIETYLWGI
jgi:hypothetical protein